MPRIAIILGRLVIGGTTTDTLQVIRYLQDYYEVLLIYGSGDASELEADYLTHYLTRIKQLRIQGFSGKIRLTEDWSAYRKIKKALLQFQPDIVHTHTAKAGLIGRLAAFRVKVPIIVHTYHGILFHGYYGQLMSRFIVLLEQRLGKRTTCLVALSTNQKRQLVDEYKVASAQKISIVPLGIDVDAFTIRQQEKRNRFRQQYLVEENEIAIGIIGRIVPIKNHRFFLQVVQQLWQDYPVRFFIIGDGILRQQLLEDCRELNIPATYFPDHPVAAPLTFTSWITEIEVVVSGLDIVTLTSFNEGTPVSLMEAQAAGLPVVATRVGGIEDIVVHQETGLLTDQGDVAQFTTYLKELIMNEFFRKRMGTKAALFAQKHFRKERQVQDLLILYKRYLWKTD